MEPIPIMSALIYRKQQEKMLNEYRMETLIFRYYLDPGKAVLQGGKNFNCRKKVLYIQILFHTLQNSVKTLFYKNPIEISRFKVYNNLTGYVNLFINMKIYGG